MTNEDKKILLKDLFARLPYGVKCKDFEYSANGNIIDTVEILETINPFTSKYTYKDTDAEHDIERIKPYLRPMSSMTEGEKKEYNHLCQVILDRFKDWKCSDLIDWLNSHHFDYRGLIEKGLSLEAPEGMYDIKQNDNE